MGLGKAPPNPGTGILARLPIPWQTCFYTGGKRLARNSLTNSLA